MEIKTETVVGLFIIVALGVLFYITIFLGFFRFNRGAYVEYTITFDHVAGLEKKADVKISGVKVGWVDHLMLIDQKAFATIMVDKKYIIPEDAQIMVKQENLLGPKYIDIAVEFSVGKPLQPHGVFKNTAQGSASIDTIMHSMENIAHNVEDITGALRCSLGGYRGREDVQRMVENLNIAMENFANFSVKLDRVASEHEYVVNATIQDLKDITGHLRQSMPQVTDSFSQACFSIDKNITRATDRFDSVAASFENGVFCINDGLKNIQSISQKIDEGRGLLGKLINEDETYRDMRVSIQGIRKYFDKIDALSIVFDSHGEYMYRPAENVNFEDAKGYVDIRIHPNEDHFYVLQYVQSQKGNIKRVINQTKWFDENFREILPSQTFDFQDKIGFTPWLFGNVEIRERTLDQSKFGAQFGKIYRDVALRVGIFENTAGFGVDFHIPLGTDRVRWITSLEAFDFRGRDRFDDKRPHLKWINRVFFMKNLYVSFGADDFVSKDNANGFFGAGLRFCDDDMKYIISQLGVRGIS